MMNDAIFSCQRETIALQIRGVTEREGGWRKNGMNPEEREEESLSPAAGTNQR